MMYDDGKMGAGKVLWPILVVHHLVDNVHGHLVKVHHVGTLHKGEAVRHSEVLNCKHNNQQPTHRLLIATLTRWEQAVFFWTISIKIQILFRYKFCRIWIHSGTFIIIMKPSRQKIQSKTLPSYTSLLVDIKKGNLANSPTAFFGSDQGTLDIW